MNELKYLNDLELKMIHDKLLTSKKYREGFLLRFKTNDDDYETFQLLIKKLIHFKSKIVNNPVSIVNSNNFHKF